MAPEKRSNHKNAVRSRQFIKKAFAELLNIKPIDKITVTDIVDRAGISRGTFYAHYVDVNDLYQAIKDNIIEAVDKSFDELNVFKMLDNPEAIIRLAITFMYKEKRYYELFISSSKSEDLINFISSHVGNKLSAEISELAKANSFDPEKEKMLNAFIIFTMGGITNLFIKWLTDTIVLTPEECTEYLTKFYISKKPAELQELLDKVLTDK